MWISNRFFTDGVSYEDVSNVRQKYGCDDWKTAIDLLDNRNKISPNAIKLAERLEKEYKIEVFPSIMITAIKGWTGMGTPNFGMVGKHGHMVFFYNTPTKYLAKKAKWDLLEYGNDTEIYI